jgi:hypothetical protein
MIEWELSKEFAYPGGIIRYDVQAERLYYERTSWNIEIFAK